MSSRFERIRKERLLEEGFLDFEASELCKVPFYVPYMQQVREDRIAWHRKELDSGTKRAEWANRVKDMYADHDYIHPETGDLDAWQFLRDYEHDYIDSHPEYTS